VCVVVVASLAASTPLRSEKSVELRKWIDGPVRYITLKEETSRFKSLETDEARALFIERFWRRRDPSPETLTNEYRELFWRRVQEANRSFLDSTKPGWMTDRGKIWVLYGPPTDVETYDDLQSDRNTGYGVIRWIYQGRPGQRMDLGPVVVVPFQRDAGGEYRLSYDPKLASVFFDELAMREGQNDIYDRFFEMVGTPSRSELSVMLDLGRMQEVPPAERVLLETVETIEDYDTLPLDVRVDRYFRPEDGSPLAVVNVDMGRFGETETPAILARFTPDDAEREPRVLGEGSFKVATSGSYRVAQARLALDAGQYELTVVVADPINVKTGIHHTRVAMPDVPQTMRLSDPVWAVEMASVEYRSLASYDEPFHLGPFRVLPKLDSAFRPGDTVKLFLEVYGAEFPLTATYQLEGLEEPDRWIPLGQPAVIEQSAGELAWEVPTSERWPLGAYRVRVEVLDREQRRVTTRVDFALEQPDGG
jgi:GWxTD domain-containing protein